MSNPHEKLEDSEYASTLKLDDGREITVWDGATTRGDRAIVHGFLKAFFRTAPLHRNAVFYTVSYGELFAYGPGDVPLAVWSVELPADAVSFAISGVNAAREGTLHGTYVEGGRWEAYPG